MARTVFVTGASGFVGQNLVKRLCQNEMKVRCLVRKSSNRTELEKLGVEFIEGDVSNRESLISGAIDSDIVFHLAGLTRSITANDFMQVNRDGCRNIAFACLEAQRKGKTDPILVSVSSLSAAGPASKNEFWSNHFSSSDSGGKSSFSKYNPKEETEIPCPISPYGKSKWAGENELISFAEKLSISIVRPPFIFGEGDRLSLPLFKMVRKLPIFLIPGYYNQQYSFIYIDDLVEIMIRVSEQGERLVPDSLTEIETQNNLNSDSLETRKRAICSGQGIYFASHWERPLFSDFGKMLSQAVGRQKIISLRCPPLGVIGTGIVQEFWKRTTKRSVSLDWNKTIEALSGPWICSAQKIEQSLAFRSKESLQEQIQRTADWYFGKKWL